MIVNAYEDQVSAEVTTYANTVNVKSKIFKFLCPDSMKYTLLSGTVLTIKLFDSTPAEIAEISRLFVSVKIPKQETPIEIQEFSYTPFSALTEAQQKDVDNQEALRIVIPMGKITIKEVEELHIEIISATLVSWASAKGSLIQFEMIPEVLV